MTGTLYTENIQSQIFKNRIIDFMITDFRDSNLITDSFNSVLNSQLNLLARCQLKRLENQIENHGSHSHVLT